MERHTLNLKANGLFIFFFISLSACLLINLIFYYYIYLLIYELVYLFLVSDSFSSRDYTQLSNQWFTVSVLKFCVNKCSINLKAKEPFIYLFIYLFVYLLTNLVFLLSSILTYLRIYLFIFS
jgi:hypothetical protein